MNTRELLELAAKAAGLQNHTWDGHSMREQAVHGVPHCGHTGDAWNSLDDDGDALRLAVKFNFDIRFDMLEEGATVLVAGQWDDAPNGAQQLFGDDVYKATRLAITEAAAEFTKANALVYIG